MPYASGFPSYSLSNSSSTIPSTTKASSSANTLTSGLSATSTVQPSSAKSTGLISSLSSVPSASSPLQSPGSSSSPSSASSTLQPPSSSLSVSLASATLQPSTNSSSVSLASLTLQPSTNLSSGSPASSKLLSNSSSTVRPSPSSDTEKVSLGFQTPLSRSLFLSGSRPGTSPNTSSIIQPSASTRAPFPITSSPSGRFSRGFVRPSNLPASGVFPGSGQVSGSAPFGYGNASMSTEEPWFYVPACTPVKSDPWQDAKSCSCVSEVYSWYHSQSTGMLTTSICHTTEGQSYGMQYSSGCSPTTETLLATSWSPPSSCCAYCAIAMPTVRLVFWEPQTAASNFSTIRGNFSLSTASTVVDDGFTL